MIDLKLLTDFFLWCTLINGGVLILWTLLIVFLPDLIYQSQVRWFAIERGRYDAIMYSLLGLFKLLFIIFNLTPLLVLLILT